MKCALTGQGYTIFGYKGKQVRDNIHSSDLVNMFWHFYQNPKSGEVYNAGGGRFANCSMKEAVSICERIAGKKMNISYSENNRSGDHIWYISDLTKFKQHYPNWNWQYGLEDTLVQIYESLSKRV
jgi:CDP-paratose 2-epimerase